MAQLLNLNKTRIMKPEQIKKIRLELKLSQEAFSKKLGVSFQSVNRWERGICRPSGLALEKLQKISKIKPLN